MPAFITSGGTTLSPLALSEYSATQDGGTILHDVLGKRDPDVTLRPVGLLSGSFTLDFATDALAAAARTSLSAAAVWTLNHTGRTIINMRFIVRRLSPVISTDGRRAVTVEFEQVP